MTFEPHPSNIKNPRNANRRAAFKSMGFSDADLERPIIGIANSWNQIVPGHVNLRAVAEHVKKGIYRAGGTAMEFGTIAACDGIAQGEGMFAILPTREIIAGSIELMVRAHSLDGIVMLGSCDKIVPGMLLAAARLNIPAIILPGGPMLGGAELNHRPSDLTSLSEAVGMMKLGKLSEEEIYTYENTCGPTCGSCSFYGSANTMCCTAEAMGMIPSGCATIPAVFAERLRSAEYTGERIVKLVEDQVCSGDILTLDALKNGIIYANATGGSTNLVLHMAALAEELGIPSATVMRLFEEYGSSVPQLALLNPASKYNTDDFYFAGGVQQVLKNLSGYIHPDCMTVDGRALGENIARFKPNYPANPDVIRDVEHAYSVGNGIAILHGNLAPDGCVTKPAAIHKDMLCFAGIARVFDSEEMAIDAILNRNIHPGDVLVIRYEGPKGGPGMREMCNAMKYLNGLGLGLSTAIITDGRFSGTNNGCFVGHISPEAAEGGTLAVVAEGDAITIDIPNRVITLHVSDDEIEARKATIKRPEPRFKKGYLSLYSKYAASASEGAVWR